MSAAHVAVLARKGEQAWAALEDRRPLCRPHLREHCPPSARAVLLARMSVHSFPRQTLKAREPLAYQRPRKTPPFAAATGRAGLALAFLADRLRKARYGQKVGSQAHWNWGSLPPYHPTP